MTAKILKIKPKHEKQRQTWAKAFYGKTHIHIWDKLQRKGMEKKNLKCILKKSKGGEKKRHGMLLKKHDEKDSAGASRKWQLFHCQQRTGGASSALLPWFVQGTCSTFPAGFNMDTHGKEKSNTWSLLGGIPVDCRVVGSSRGRECSAHCETFPLAATQEFLWEPQVLLACVVLKQTLSVPQKIRSALIICTRWRGQLQHWLLWFIPALLPRFILLPARSHRGCSNTAEI